MVAIYELMQKILKLFVNILFMVQITLMILIFLTATFWFLELLGFSQFDFVAPLANAIITFMHQFYQKEVEIGGVAFDGALLLFDLIGLGIVFVLSKVKIQLYRTMEQVQFSIDDCNEKIEQNFNSRLQKDLEKTIRRMNNVAILVEFAAKNSLVDARWGGDITEGVREKEDEAFAEFYGALKVFPECKFAKTENKMLIIIKDFKQADRILNYIDDSINNTREEMKKKRWLLSSYIGIEVYDDSTDFKSVYPTLQKLLSLRIQNEALCYGNFCMRYELEPEQQYEPLLKGSYAAGVDDKIWSLIKKARRY